MNGKRSIAAILLLSGTLIGLSSSPSTARTSAQQPSGGVDTSWMEAVRSSMGLPAVPPLDGVNVGNILLSKSESIVFSQYVESLAATREEVRSKIEQRNDVIGVAASPLINAPKLLVLLSSDAVGTALAPEFSKIAGVSVETKLASVTKQQYLTAARIMEIANLSAEARDTSSGIASELGKPTNDDLARGNNIFMALKSKDLSIDKIVLNSTTTQIAVHIRHFRLAPQKPESLSQVFPEVPADNSATISAEQVVAQVRPDELDTAKEVLRVVSIDANLPSDMFTVQAASSQKKVSAPPRDDINDSPHGGKVAWGGQPGWLDDCSSGPVVEETNNNARISVLVAAHCWNSGYRTQIGYVLSDPISIRCQDCTPGVDVSLVRHDLPSYANGFGPAWFVHQDPGGTTYYDRQLGSYDPYNGQPLICVEGASGQKRFPASGSGLSTSTACGNAAGVDGNQYRLIQMYGGTPNAICGGDSGSMVRMPDPNAGGSQVTGLLIYGSTPGGPAPGAQFVNGTIDCFTSDLVGVASFWRIHNYLQDAHGLSVWIRSY